MGDIKNKNSKNTIFILSAILIILITIKTIPIKIDTVENQTWDDSTKSKTETPQFSFENPYNKSFDLVGTFFQNNYISSLDPNISTYFRYGDINGIITDDTIFSEDNLFIYNSLLKSEINQTETFDSYLKLKSTPLWYENITEPFKYGFVKSVNNSTRLVKNSDRYLVDNVLPIFLLIDNIGENIDVLSLEGQKPKELIEEMFSLISSSEFWDNINNGFAHHNSTSDKYSESNFISILANLLIHRTYHQLDLDESIKNLSYFLANQTIISMNSNMWDSTDKAYYSWADKDWSTLSAGQKYYHLDVNALGIITLLEFWVESGMENDSSYLLRAVELYNSLDNNLWDISNKLYYNIGRLSWDVLIDSSNDLKANALMLEACLKLFELTGNVTYYNRAVEIFESFENDLFDGGSNSYDFSLTNSTKNLNSNLNLRKSYLKASEIFRSTSIKSDYNLTETIPNYLIDQDVMNLTSVYSFIKENQYYNPGYDSYVPFTVSYNITDTDITYLLKYPNGTFLSQIENQIIDPDTSHSLIYPIEETLPIGNGYYIYIWANKSYFNLAETLTRFNVVSGLVNETIKGLPDILFQGQTINVTLLLNYTRVENLTLTASLEGEDITIYPSQELNFTASTELNVSFDLTAKFGVNPGPSEITFNFKRGNIIYLSVKKIIEIVLDIFPPNITVQLPLNSTYWAEPPLIKVNVFDVYLDKIWYNISGIPINEFLQNDTAEYLNDTIWDNIPQGMFEINFYANDSAGNLDNMFTYTLYKDTYAPNITIHLPLNNTYWNEVPLIKVGVFDVNLDEIWYTISNNSTKEFLQNNTEEYLNNILWANLLQGPFEIHFYANDSLGNIGNQDISINKYIGMWLLSPFTIDDLGGGDYTWLEASIQGWCKGSGTSSDPYVIENILIDGQNSGSCIEIKNSNEHMVIYNSIFTNSGDGMTDAGIGLFTSNHVELVSNNCSNNNAYGIYLSSCQDILIEGSTINNNAKSGIMLYESDNNIIRNNIDTINSNTEYGIYLSTSHYNEIMGNSINYNSVGIYFYESNYNTITDNDLQYNSGGALVREGCTGNVFTDNNPPISGGGVQFPFEMLILIIAIGAICALGITGAVVLKKRGYIFNKVKIEKKQALISKDGELKEYNIFLSYSTKDSGYFQLPKIVKRMEQYPKIGKVLYWEVDSGENIVEYMEKTLKECNIFVLFCSENSIKSNAVSDEWQAAFQLRKKGLLKIVPVYEDEKFIPALLTPLLNVQYSSKEFVDFISKLYNEILRE